MGLGGIAKRVIEGIVLTPSACLYAVASRDVSKAEAIRESSGAKKAYGDYEAMLEDPLVDVVYICTPNYLHHAHIMAALAHHKHVICEKPLVSNEAQLRECFAYAKEQQCFLMEAEKTLFTPLNQKIKEMIEDGVIGKVSYIEGSYGFLLPSEGLSTSYWGIGRKTAAAFMMSVFIRSVMPIILRTVRSNRCSIVKRGQRAAMWILRRRSSLIKTG